MKLSYIFPLLIGLSLIFYACKQDGGKEITGGIDDPTLNVTSISPTSGPEGTEVTITGTGFSTTASENAVSFNGTNATVSASTATSITTEVPAGATSGAVSVTVSGETVTGPGFTVEEAVTTISDISPTAAKFGETVTVNGENFPTNISDIEAYFEGGTFFLGDSLQATVLSATKTAIELEVPKGAGSGDIRLFLEGEYITGPEFTYLETVQVTTFAGNGTPGSADGLAEDATLDFPAYMAFDEGNLFLYITEYQSGNIRKIDLTTYQVTTLTLSPASPFTNPSGIAVGPGGTLYVSDFAQHQVFEVDPVNGTTTVFSGTGAAGSTDGNSATATFNQPDALEYDETSGDLFLSDYGNGLIRRINSSGAVSTYASTNLNKPAGLQIIPDNTGGPIQLLIANSGDHIISRTNGTQTAGVIGTTQGFTDGDGATAQFSLPNSVAISPLINAGDGVFYVADYGNHAIRKVDQITDPDTGNFLGNVVRTLAGTGSSGYVNGEGSSAQFSLPWDMSIIDNESQQSRFIFVTDSNNHTIRLLTIE